MYYTVFSSKISKKSLTFLGRADIVFHMTKQKAPNFTPEQTIKYIGGLTETSKLNCFSYGISARRCVTGSKLRNVKGSVCNSCYALKGRFNFSNVQGAMEKRYKAINKKYWRQAMEIAIKHTNNSNLFRIFSSGDCQSVKMFADWCEIARNTPKIRYWMSTREAGMIAEYIEKGGNIPENLTVRLSSFMVDSEPPVLLAKKLGVVTSGVSKNGDFNCPASLQGGKCLDCVKCWDRNVPNVNYKAH